MKTILKNFINMLKRKSRKVSLILLALLLLFLVFAFWKEVNYFTKSISNFVDVASKILTSFSAILAAITYYKKIQRERNNKFYNMVITKNKYNQFNVKISITNNSSITHAYSLKGMKYTRMIKLNQLTMTNILSFDNTVKLNNKDSLNVLVNTEPNKTLLLAELTVTPNSNFFKKKYLQIIFQEENGDNFNFPIETNDFKF